MKFEDVLLNSLDEHLSRLLQRVGVHGEHFEERAETVDAIMQVIADYQHACRMDDKVRGALGAPPRHTRRV